MTPSNKYIFVTIQCLIPVHNTDVQYHKLASRWKYNPISYLLYLPLINWLQ